MEYRKTAGGISWTQPRQQRHRYRTIPRRLFDCGSDDDNNNNNNNNNNVSDIVNNTTTTTLVDELERLRTDNFQLRLRVYNAERRVDRLSASAAAERFGRGRNRCDEYNTDESNGSDSDTSSTENDNINDAAAAKATAEAAVRTIHDLLTVNRRLLALLATTVSAKAVAVTAADKRRWRRLQNHIDDFDGEQDGDEEKKLWQENDNESDVSTTDSETYTARVTGASANRTVKLLSPPPPPPTEHKNSAVVEHDDGAELSRLRARCQRLERSLQQLVNTELWARNRQIGKLEQQLQADATAEHKDRRTAVSQHSRSNVLPTTTTTKGILVIRSPTSSVTEVPRCPTPAAAEVVTITTPPPVLPDYSEVNFFFSCDEEDDNQENDCTESNGTGSSSSENSDSDDSDGEDETEPVCLLQPNPTAVAIRPQKRQCVRYRQQQPIQSIRQTAAGYVETATTWSSSSSTECLAMRTGNLSVGGVTSTTSPTLQQSRRRRRRTTNGRSYHRRRRYIQPRCSACGCSTGGGKPIENHPPPNNCSATIVADAQVQCSDDDVEKKNNNNGDEDQLLLLRRELDARRRENCRLYDMLLKLQCGRGPMKNVENDDPNSNDLPDRTGSPEQYRQAACAIRGRIADLLPPLLSVQSTSVGSPPVDVKTMADPQPSQSNGMDEQQQQQLLLLTRLRERIVAYERHELQLDGRGSCSDPVLSADPDNAVHHMDRADLINVALPRTVDRLRRVLMPLIQQQQQQQRLSDEEQPITNKERQQLQGR